MLDNFGMGKSALQDDAVRARLQQAIIDNDPPRFREVLNDFSPELAQEERVYSVLIMTDEGMRSILVDSRGERIGSDYTIPAGMPIDILNVRFEPGKMIATIDGEEWSAPYKLPEG